MACLSPVLVGAFALLSPFVREARAAGEAWSAERLSAFFDGAEAARDGVPAVPPAGASQPGGVTAPPEGSTDTPRAGAPGAGGLSPVPEGGRGAAYPEGVNLSGPDEGVKGSPVSPMGTRVPPVEEIPNSDWRTVGHLEDAVSDQNPSAREKQDFWDKLRNGAFWHDIGDQVCKQAKIPLDYNLKVGDTFNAKPGFSRFLRTGVDGRMVLVDRAELGVALGGGVPLLSEGALGVSLSLGAEIRGMSMVSRPLKGAKACKELDELIDLRTIKMVYPLGAARFEKMEVGEIWAMPLVTRATFGAGAGYPVAGVTPVTVSFGYSREGGVNVTLRRLDKDSLRVRIRIDYARVHGPAIGLDYTITGSNFYEEYRTIGRDLARDSMGSLIGEKVVFNGIDRLLRREMEKYVAIRLQWLTQWIREDHAVIEFVLNPNDKEQMKGLEELLAGGELKVIDSLYKRFKTAGMAFLDMKDLKDRIPDLRKSYDEALEKFGSSARTFTGTDRAESMVRRFRMMFPILFDYKSSSGRRDDRITVLDDAGGEYGIYRAHKESERGFIGIPFLGQVYNYNQRRSVMTYTHADKDGKAQAPGLVFTRQAGYTKHSEDSARSLAVEVNEVMRLAGTRGQGVNAKTALPLDKVFPMTPRREEEWTSDGPPPARDTGPTYDRGMGAFTLVLGDKAVADILGAEPEDVIRAFAAATDSWDKEAIRWAVQNGKVMPDGSVKYDWRKSPYYDPFPSGDDSRNDPEGAVRSALYDAKRLVRKLQEARALRPEGCTDPAAANRQAAALRDIVNGSSGMKYEDILKVLVQLTDAKNVTAEFIVSAKPDDKKKPVVEGRYLLNRGMEEDQALRALAETSSKFNAPTEYTD